MNIIRTSKQLDKRETYKHTKAPSTSVREIVGVPLTVSSWCLYEDVNTKGEDVEVLTLLVDGNVYSTISETFKKDFFDIVEVFGDELPDILVIEGTTKSGRAYVDVTIV